jgi:DNA polymerase-3 subunit gamma/tau
MALYNDHRPQELSELYGNDTVVDLLEAAITDGSLAHTILLSGPSGCGKTTIARILADHVRAGHDLREMNIGKDRGIDTARNINQMVKYKPLRSDKRVVVLNECHKGTPEFWNALLEVLEEPPDHTYFILCTTEPEKLITTVRNRCVQYVVERLKVADCMELCAEVAEHEDKDISPAVLRRIAQTSQGSPRAALSILEKVFAAEDEETQLEVASVLNEVEDFDLKAVCQIILRGGRWESVAKELKNFNGDVEQVRRAMLGYFTAVLLNSKTPNDKTEAAAFAITNLDKNFFDSGKAGLVLALYIICNPD